jgi:TM2 domain-containing membrane protein YozV
MAYEWEKDLAPYTSQSNIKKLRKLVDERIAKGKILKRVIIAADVIIIGLIVLLIGGLNILKMGADTRNGLINGLIAIELAIITFLSPISTSTITKKEVDEIACTDVTADIMGKIGKSVEQKASGIQKSIAIIGACGIFAALILNIFS